MRENEVQGGSIDNGDLVEILAERETAYLPGSETMKVRTGGIAFEAAVGKLGL